MQHAQQPQKFSGLTAMHIPWRHSLFSHLLAAFIGLAAGLSVLAALLTAAWHRFVLTPMMTPEQLMTTRDQLITGLFVVSVFTILLAAGIAYLLTHHITRPLRDIMQAIDRLAHDDISVQLETNRRDEVGAMAVLFNSMVKKIREARQRSDALQRIKSQFISTAAHQLRTPLTGLKWSLNYLLDKVDLPLPERTKTLRDAAATTDNMMHLVNALLNVSKVEAGKFGLTLSSVNIGELLAGMTRDYAARAREQKLTLTLDSDLDTRLKIVADPDYLRLLFANLLDNAIDYTPAGGSIIVSLSLARDFVQTSVHDTGIGIPATDQEKIFTQFHRADNAKKIKTDGSGLGLFIARNIARRHGGELTFVSSESKGTTFTLKLPLHEELIPKAQSLDDVLTEI